MVESPEDSCALPPVSPDDPCGPDLDLAGDSDFMNFMATTEGQLPAAYFSFDRKTIDFPAALETAGKLLARAHDLRLLVLMAKLAILNRDLQGFAHWLGAIAWLVVNHWDDAHPRAEDGDYAARLVQLATLDDGPVVALPLQYAPLVETQRDGVLVFRAQLVASGDAKAREGESRPSAGAIDKILMNVDLDKLAAAMRDLRAARAAIETIRAVSIERVGFEQAISFNALAPLLDRMTAFLRGALARRDPAAALTPEASDRRSSAEAARAEAPAPPPPMALATLADIDAALGAALGYFAASEPSSPALLLIGQARETLGKNLYDVMKLLAPAHADAARVFVGPDGAFTVPVSGLSGAPGAEFPRADAEPAPSRAAALALIDNVASHMRRVEPSSPAPYLLDRAKALASRDFLSLLQDVLPEDDLASMKSGR
jgi:type VI secretion system protein ImpA